MTRGSAPEGASRILAAKRDQGSRYHRINYLPAYPEYRREKWDREDRERYERRLSALEDEVAQLRRSA